MEQCVCVAVAISQVSGLFLGAHGGCGAHSAPGDSAQSGHGCWALRIFPPPLRGQGWPSRTVLVDPLAFWLPDHRGREEREAEGLRPQLCSPKWQVVWVPLVSVTLLPALQAQGNNSFPLPMPA